MQNLQVSIKPAGSEIIMQQCNDLLFCLLLH